MDSTSNEIENEENVADMDSFTDLVASFHGYILSHEELMHYATNATLPLRKEMVRNDIYRNEKHPSPRKKTPLIYLYAQGSQTDEKDTTPVD